MRAAYAFAMLSLLAACHRSPEEKVRRLQAKADAACRCERKGDQGCGAGLAAAFPADAYEIQTMCAPVSAVVRCWTEAGKDRCVTLRRVAELSKPPNATLCSPAEAAEAERILTPTYLAHTPAAERAEQAVRALAARGTVQSSARPSCGG